MEHPAATDTGTVLDPDEAAIVTTDGMTRMALMLPAKISEDDNVEVPEVLLYLTAVAMRGQDDPEFFAEQIEWMESRKV